MTTPGSSAVKGEFSRTVAIEFSPTAHGTKEFPHVLEQGVRDGRRNGDHPQSAVSHAAMSAPAVSDSSANATIGSQLHQGDLVRLRSGGPLMTVDGVKGDQVECVWTDLNNGQPDDATFPADMLQKF